MRILCVCHGNICRSPMAEGLLRRHLTKRGLDVEVASAGVGAWYEGNPPDQRAVAVAARHGLDISGNEARKLRVADFRAFDRVLAMDRSNLDMLARRRPAGARAAVALFDPTGREVIDPYYGSETAFERSFRLLDAAAGEIAENLEESLLRRVG